MRQDLVHAVGGGAAVAAVTALYVRGLGVSNHTTVALSFLLIVLVVAATSRLAAAVATSLVAVFCFNFFFQPPVGTLTIADPQNWVALLAFLAVSLVASNLSSAVRAKAQDAFERRDEMTRLFDLSRDVLLLTEGREAITSLARSVVSRFEAGYVAICLPEATGTWDVCEAGTLDIDLPRSQVALAAVSFEPRHVENARAGEAQRSLQVGAHEVRLIPLRVGAKSVGVLGIAGHRIEAGTLDALAGVVAIAIERVQFLAERRAAELARQSDALKSTVLASLGHDLRTPLAAIKVAASNLRASWLSDADREVQSELVLKEVERLQRLFQNILEMARLDAGAVAAERRWVHPSEIVEGASVQVEHSLRGHRLEAHVDVDALVKVDPRLTAAALGHVLENAAQYSPPGAGIELTVTIVEDELRIIVRDHGPGIDAAELSRVFDRFFRGSAGRSRTSGTGMGLAIARGFIAAEQGRVWAENAASGGAAFTIAVPVETRHTAMTERAS